MAFELLGPNLEDLLNYCGGKFSLKTVLMLAGQLISRFKHIHRKGYIHRDVKPENLLMGLDRQGNTLYITDIGLAEELDPRERKYPGLVGTARYASINSHLRRGKEPNSYTIFCANPQRQSKVPETIWSPLGTSFYTLSGDPYPGRASVLSLRKRKRERFWI